MNRAARRKVARQQAGLTGNTDCSIKPLMPYLPVSPHRTSEIRRIRQLAGHAPDVMKGVNLHPLSMRKLRLIRHALLNIIQTRADAEAVASQVANE